MVFLPLWAMGPAQPRDPCVGGERSQNDERCCPFDTWDNAGFAHATDASTMLWLNESRSRRVLRELFARSHPDAVDEAGLLELAQSVRAPAGLGLRMLVARGQRALAAFEALFPESRWRTARGEPTDCEPSGHDVWRAVAAWTEPQVRTLEALTGTTLTGAQRSALVEGRGWHPSTPRPVVQWLTDSWALSHRVPGGAPHERASRWPSGRDALVVVEPDDPFEGAGSVAPGPWLREVLDRYAPPRVVRLPEPSLGERIAEKGERQRQRQLQPGLPTGKRRPGSGPLDPGVGDALGDALGEALGGSGGGGGGGLPSPAPGGGAPGGDGGGPDDAPALPQPDLDTPSYYQLQQADGRFAGWLYLGRGEARVMAAALAASPEGLAVREASGEPVG